MFVSHKGEAVSQSCAALLNLHYSCSTTESGMAWVQFPVGQALSVHIA